MAEQLSRNASFFGEEGQRCVETAFVVVVGLGGVGACCLADPRAPCTNCHGLNAGSHAAHMLARAGVGRLRVVDFDQVTLSSLNRHAVATRGDVGLPKATVLRDHLLQVVPHCDIDARAVMFTATAAGELLEGASARRSCPAPSPLSVAVCRSSGLCTGLH